MEPAHLPMPFAVSNLTSRKCKGTSHPLLIDYFLQGRPVPGIDTGISPAHSFYHVSDPVGIASIDQESLFDHPEAKDRIFKVEQHNVIRVVVQWLNGCKVGANALR